MSGPGPRQAMALVLLVFLLLVTVGVGIQVWNMRLGLLLTEIGLIGLPTVLACRLGGHPLGSALGLSLPPEGRLGFAVRFGAALGPVASLAALGFTLPVLLLLVLLGGTYPGVGLPLSGPADLAWALFTATLLAPVCEELLFRGLLLRAFRPLGVHRAVGLAAVCFGIFHMDPVRFVPTALLGVVFGYLAAWSGSTYPAMAAHAVNNGLVLLTAYFLGGGEDEPATGVSYAGLRDDILHALEASNLGVPFADPEAVVRLALILLAVSFLVVGTLLAAVLALALRWFAVSMSDSVRSTSPRVAGATASRREVMPPVSARPSAAPAERTAVPGLLPTLVRLPAAWGLALAALLIWAQLLILYFPD